MILVALRILFGAALAFGLSQVWQNEQVAPRTGDLANAFYLAVCVVLAMANAVVWAPYFADAVSGPLTGVMTNSTYVDRKNLPLLWIHWLDRRGLRRLTAWFCFLEGIRHPDRPAAFVIGLTNARRGSWLEKVYAREVFRFDNAQNCLLAYEALRRHDIDPRPHHNPEVNMLLMSLEREVRPATEPVPIPPAPPPAPLKRDRRIRLFEANQPDARDGAAPQPADDRAGNAPAAAASTTENPGPGEELVPVEPAPAAGGEKAGLLARIRTFWCTH